MKKVFGPLWPLIASFALLIGFLALARAINVWIFADHINGINDLWRIFIFGLRIDLVTATYFLALPALLFLTIHTFGSHRTRRSAKIFLVWIVAVCVAIFFMEAVTPLYILEYGTRPERKFFEYLNHPREVFWMLVGTYGVAAIIILSVTALVAPLAYWAVGKTFKEIPRWSFVKLVIMLPLLLMVFFAMGRSSLDHRALNPSMVAFSDDVLVNNLPLNSLYSVLYSVYRLKDEANAAAIYGRLSEEKIDNYVYTEHNALQGSKDTAVVRHPNLKNVVIILEESLGARFVERLGGQPLTPNLNQLAADGWWFSRLYATGTRSVRGIEAVTTGFLPTPGRSVVKLAGSQSQFFTLAALLDQYGYMSRFYYGGSAHFDNMKGFVLGNGFHQVVEQKDFNNARYAGSWGVSDEDVFNRMHADLIATPAQPQLMVVLTTSNHTPFDFPVEASEHYSKPFKTRENAIRYADKALGEFIQKAKSSPYWENSVFLIVADHDLRVADFTTATDLYDKRKTNKIFPVEGFHIPGLILGGAIQPKVSHYIVSQIDLPATLLGLLHINASTPMLGVDLTKVNENYTGRAIMQFTDYQAYLQDEKMVVLRPNLPPLTGRYTDKRFVQAPVSKDLKEKALAHALWASKSYKKQSYQLPQRPHHG